MHLLWAATLALMATLVEGGRLGSQPSPELISLGLPMAGGRALEPFAECRGRRVHGSTTSTSPPEPRQGQTGPLYGNFSDVHACSQSGRPLLSCLDEHGPGRGVPRYDVYPQLSPEFPDDPTTACWIHDANSPVGKVWFLI